MLYSQELAASRIGLYVNANKTEFASEINRPVHQPQQQHLIY